MNRINLEAWMPERDRKLLEKRNVAAKRAAIADLFYSLSEPIEPNEKEQT